MIIVVSFGALQIPLLSIPKEIDGQIISAEGGRIIESKKGHINHY
jgi:hypothetical protein